ncbi:hypothetical protein [Ruegeria sp. HKCCA6707]|uniref:NYN domain-containing protein n=2 Tax=unclassified Ruegeria TaxID=2625375 RepID=UPI001488C4E9|nr:hypothetical protein [Ruegeria sp. HKCCA6707]
MRVFLIVFLLSFSATAIAIVIPSFSVWLLLSVPCAISSALLLARKWLRRPKNWAVIDGSNVMHWKDGEPSLDTVRDVVDALKQAGLTPGVVFDANVGYKVSDRYMRDTAPALHLGLPKNRVMVAPKGVPADPYVLQVAKDYDATIVTNDRFRDWAEDYADVMNAKDPVRGGYKNGKLWLSLDRKAAVGKQ